MNIIQQTDLAIPDVKVIRFGRSSDHRGYFVETFNQQALDVTCSFLKGFTFKQANESFSFANTLRGLHMQTGMGKLVRLIYGKMVDFALDWRSDSATYQHIIGYELQSTCDYSEWIWLPPGFAHGVWLQENSMIEYFCTQVYNPQAETTVSFFSNEIKWELCNADIYKAFREMDVRDFKIKDSDK